MSTQIAKTLNASDVAAAQKAADAVAAAANPAIPANTFVFFVGFDGTRNIASNPAYSGDPQSTAVGQIYNQVFEANIGKNKIKTYYVPGVGTPGTQPGSEILPTAQAKLDAERAYNTYADHISHITGAIGVAKAGKQPGVSCYQVCLTPPSCNRYSAMTAARPNRRKAWNGNGLIGRSGKGSAASLRSST